MGKSDSTTRIRDCDSESRKRANFTSSGKDLVRQCNLAFVHDTIGLWTNDTRQLKCDWVELAGTSIHHTIQMLEDAKALRTGSQRGFIGVDKDRERIAQLRLKHPDLQWLAGDLRHHISWLCTHAKVGVLNFDGYMEIGTRDTGATFTTFRPLVRRGISLFGSFVLLATNDLTSVVRHPRSAHRGQPEVALRMHTEMIIEKLGGYADRRSLPEFDELLPPDFVDKIKDPRFSGPLGAYRIYTGGTGNKLGHRMITLGLRL